MTRNGTASPLSSAARKPRLLVAGEFSAGKTRLITGLLGEGLLPSEVTATALPPIWLVSGSPAMVAVGEDGRMRPIGALTEVDVVETRFCIVSHPAPFLDHYDVIDTPGNSDPNIPAEKWDRMLDFADAVVWVTNATQAWRQSEKSAWEEMPDRLRQDATLVVSHADRIGDETQAERVMRRVRREADAYFDTFLLASLIDSADLGRIRDHLLRIAPSIALEGRPDRRVRDHAAAHPLPQAQAAAAPVSLAPPSLAPLSLAAYALTPSPAAAPAASEGARALWQRLSRGLDTTDATAILACLGRFLDAIDGPGRAKAPPSGPADKMEDPSEVPITATVERRVS